MGRHHELQALMDIYLLLGGNLKTVRLPRHREGGREIKLFVRRHRRSEGKLWAIVLAALTAIRRLHKHQGQQIMIDHFPGKSFD